MRAFWYLLRNLSVALFVYDVQFILVYKKFMYLIKEHKDGNQAYNFF